ncbi:cytochrome c biogenesis heme-transporting ATPase CcmA [Pantoea stewartii]|uniref:cytochrome c biogenesis heme-transporting ATPase CcmA n=1 Tax=Pantoea stewartii TaxID=66269 RepID=UPI001561B470|nr:cytochrome c biogenesis heme-transporting ATPase CcmA [Pantoea stewartii]NRH23674.1 heme ABC transporter ATP-binding protein CcmA [Pantoea stewartii]
MLEIINLLCVRDERALFEALTFRVLAGDIVQIEGPNGAGKTSLLRILAGLSTPEHGEVRWQSQPVHRQRDTWHQAMLYLGHLPGISSALSALENLRFYHPDCRDEHLFTALASVGLAGYEEVAAAQLSAGQQRRIALARLWLTQATLWILDEPLTALDHTGVETLMSRFVAHTQQGGSVIVTSHQALPGLTGQINTIRLHAVEWQ